METHKKTTLVKPVPKSVSMCEYPTGSYRSKHCIV